MSRQQPNGGPNGLRNYSNGSNPSLPQTSSNPSMMNGAGGATLQTRMAPMSRAERFEDEKRRIIDSCFSKVDQSGQLAESYITHIRIVEDALYPSAPPPPDSPQENKKPRLIIIAVRSTGRVRMHKARENNNGSFSIGKTWNLEDLSAIESYASTSTPAQNDLEAQNRARAGNTGFTVTITKPYYWQAGTPKEKEFFIASAVKIYRKYTKGQSPDLRGFDEKQRVAMLGGAASQPQSPPQQRQPRAPESRELDEDPLPAPPQLPFAPKGESREHSRYRGSPGPPPSLNERDGRSASYRGGSRRPSETSPAPFAPPPLQVVPRSFVSTENLRGQSPGGSRQDQRAGTSTGRNGLRSPSVPASQAPRALSQQSSRSNMRPESPPNLSSSGRGRSVAPPVFAPTSTLNDAVSRQLTDDRPSEPQQPKSPSSNGMTGAGLFQSTRERWLEQREGDQSPQLPPIEPSAPLSIGKSRPKTPTSAVPKVAELEVPSPVSPDTTNFASISGFLGPDHATAIPPPAPVVTEEALGPMAPPRSRRRPTLETSLSDTTVETRTISKPAPLGPRSMTPDVGRDYVPPVELPTPDSEDLPRIRPLAPTKNLSDSASAVPALQRAPIVPSPLASRPQTPGNEPTEDELAAQTEEFRPGLGPMIKKKAVADRMKKAAITANAFKPRPGGAAEKILKAKAEREANGEPDGITGVVPRPMAKRDDSTLKQTDNLAVKEPTRADSPLPPKVEISSPLSPTKDGSERDVGGMDGANGVQLHDDVSHLQAPAQQEDADSQPTEQQQLRTPQVRVKRRSVYQERYLDELGIDRSLLADKAVDFEMMLHDFGWNNAALSPKALAEMEADLRREQSRMNAGSWLSAPGYEMNTRQERENQVLNLMDHAIQECDEMDGLLTIYNVELSSLNDDIAYIEAQSQGLQVQAANQRNLQNELTNLVSTLSLDKKVLDPLKYLDLSNPHSLQEAEKCLVQLYQAMVTIDPSVRSTSSGRPRSRNGMSDNHELSSMAAVRKKRDAYLQQSGAFCQRLIEQLDSSFAYVFHAAKGQALIPAAAAGGGMKLNIDAYNTARRGLWIYGPLILFAKELNQPAWHSMLKQYQSRVKPMYADSFGQNVTSWKKSVRKVSGDEADILFTAQEKEDATGSSGLASSARRKTVKRSQTLAKTLRNVSGEKASPSESRNAGALHFSEVFCGAMDEMAPLVSQEQNFVVDLFHASSLETADFIDTVVANPVEQRYGSNLIERKTTDPDREMANTVTTVMNEIFAFFTNDMSLLLDWSVSVDPIQGVGVMACLSRHSYYLHDSSQEFLVQLLDTLTARLQNLFAKFVDEQIRAIEDTKVKIKKRKGVIGFMKTFPHFSAAVENSFAAVGGADYEVEGESMFETRRRVDEAYNRINRAMFDSLKVIAKETPNATHQAPKLTSGGDDPDDKAKLNYHVLIIENMNHYLEEVDDGGRKNSVLADWKNRAEIERAEALGNYVGQVLRRPLGKLMVSAHLPSPSHPPVHH